MSGGLDIASLGIEVRADGVYISTKALKDLTKASKDAESQTKRTGSAAKSASSSFDSMASSVNFLSGVLKLEILRRVAMEIYELGKNVYKANLEMQSINNTFKAATGSATLGAQEMSFLREESKRLGLDLLVAADGYKTLTAAAKGTVLEGEGARNVFLAIAEASTVLGLSSQKTEMALYAVQQMISKGVVSMEELRRQLGDQIPGAFQIAARAMGLGEREFNKLVESGQLFTSEFMPAFIKAMREQFAGGVEDASQSARAELNRFNNAILELKLDIGEGGFFNAMTEAIREFARVLDDPNMKENMRAIGELAGKVVSGIGSVAKYANLRGRSGLQDQVTDLFKSGEIGWGDKRRLDSKLGGFMGTGFEEGTTIGEKWDGMLEAQKEIDNILKAREERQKEAQRLANPAQLSRDMELAARQSLEAAKREADQLEKTNEARTKGFEDWKKSIANINDQQRAINKLNDDYNAKVVTGISVLQKYGLSKEQADAVSKGQQIDGMDVMPTATRAIIEQAKEQFALAKRYRDQEEQEIMDKQAREDKKTSDMYNKRQKKLNDINQDLAKLTMSDLDRELMDVDIKFSEIAAELGNIPPALIQWRDLQKELVTQNFADEMRDALNEYTIHLKEAEVATSGIGEAALDVFTLQAQKAKELANIRKEYYRVGADNSMYEELSAMTAKQYDLQISAAQYSAEWEGVLNRLEHAQVIAETLGQGNYEAARGILKAQLEMVQGNALLDPLIRARQEQEIIARLTSLERDNRKDIANTMRSVYDMEASYRESTGKPKEALDSRVKMLEQEMKLAAIGRETADTYAEQLYYLQQMASLSQQLEDTKAERDLDVLKLVSRGVDEGVTQAHQEAVDFYKNAFPSAIDTASSALSQFANDVVRGNATMEDAWSALGNTVSDVVGSILQDLTKMYLKMAIMGLADALIGSFSGGFNVGDGIGTSTGTGGGFNMGGGVVTGLHSGGIVGTDATFQRLVDMNMFMSAPKYHSGLMPGEMPAILKKDEGVFTPAQMRALGSSSGGSNVVVNVIESPGNGGQRQERQEGGTTIIDIMVEQIEAKLASNTMRGQGPLYSANKQAFGLSRAPGAY